MADLKISQLTGATTPLAGTEELPLVQGGATRKVSVANLTAGRAITALSLATDAAAANVTISGTDFTAGGSNSDVSLSLRPKGYGVVNVYNSSDADACVMMSGNGTGGDPFFRMYDRVGALNLEFQADTGAGSRSFDFYGRVRPGVNNSSDMPLGDASKRWPEVFAANGVINTSDEREKQDIAELNEAEKLVAASLKGLIKKFKFKEAVERKGDVARIHVGVIAQEVIAAFQAQGLDAMQYGIVCYDEWSETPEIKVPELDAELEETGRMIVVQHYQAAGNIYGIRYEQLLAFIIAAL